jgi:hypothetical protein
MYNEFVYVLKAGPYFKIGRTNDITKRIAQISLQMPFKVELFKVINTDDSHCLEEFLHEQWKQYRTNGEWFHPPMPEIIRIWKYPPVWSGESEIDGLFLEHIAMLEQIDNDIIEEYQRKLLKVWEMKRAGLLPDDDETDECIN